MKFLREGKQFHLLLQDYYFSRFEYAGDITIQFQPAEPQDLTIKLILTSHFSLTRGRDREYYQVENLKGFHQLTDLWKDQIESIKASREGVLQLKTRKGALLKVEDGPFENWDFWIYKDQRKRQPRLHLIGGMGRLVII